MLGIIRAMVIAGMRAEKPQMTESELRQELFLRYDGDAFSPEQRQKILAAIADSWRREEAAQDV
jgi:predicted nuclease of restriction endonuclease-like RecB superfamily